MDGQKTAGSVFMCRLCNLFSPSRAQLLAHCSQQHAQREPPDDIIVSLQPLVGEPVETLTVGPIKRKRGRPKGSKKKTCTDATEGKADSTLSPEDNDQREGEGNKEEGDTQCALDEGEKQSGTLECRNCHRSFSNRRQILKHICLGKEQEEDDEEENRGGGVRGSGATDPNQTQENKARPRCTSEKDPESAKLPRSNQSRTSKTGSQAAGNKKTVINVVLKEDETLPGVFKMVPIEDSPAETDSAAVCAPAPSQPKDVTSDVTACEGNPKTDQESSSDPTGTTAATTTTAAAAAASRGFQEYSIKQDAMNLLQSQLKIFACEFCNKIFKFRHSLVAHLRTHTQEKPFQCPHCEYASAIKANLNVHLRKHTGEKFSCQHCPFSCLSPGHLKVHVERVHLKVKQHCGFCEKKYSDVKNLLSHMEKQHDLKDPAVHQSYQQLRLKTRQGLRQLLYHCPTCNRRFKNQLERERHLLVHGPQRPFACLLCDHAVTKMEALVAHVRKHLFLYVCCVCDGKFVSSQKLVGHLKESHAELDQAQALTNCINNSFYLMQPGRATWGNEEREDTEERVSQGCRIEQEGEDKREGEEGSTNAAGAEEWRDGGGENLEVAMNRDISEQATSQGEEAEEVCVTEGVEGKEGELDKGGAQLLSQDVLHRVVPSETQENAPAANEEHTVSSSGDANSHLSPAPPVEDGQSLQSEQVSGDYGQSAFQQVFSSLQKTQLNMETFQRLRKIYGDLECQYCGKLFWYKVHYNVHVRTHTKEHSHYCSKCSYSSITKSSLKRHQIQKHSGLLLPCSHGGCTYTTADKYKLQAHLRMHEEQGKSVTCPVCQQNYPEHRLRYHIKTSHPDTLLMQGKGVMVKRAEKCPYCDSYFLKNSSDFQRHIWAHQGLKPYMCSMCDYAGRSRNNLKTHMNRHNTERRHLCDLCGKKFKSKVTLKSHRLSHTDEGKRFQCSECDFTSVSKPSLLRHMEQHAAFKPFRCAHCRYSCNTSGPLKRHYKMKHLDQKYHNAGPGPPNPDALEQQGGVKCPQCEFVYGTKWELNRHLKSKHSLKVVEGTWEVGQAGEAQYVPVKPDEQLTEAPVAALQDNVSIQQITEFSPETYDAVTSMVAMAPGTVTVVQQVADEQEVTNCGNQLMVVNDQGALTGNQVMVVNEEGALTGNQVMVVNEEGALTGNQVMVVNEEGALTGNQVMVVEDAHALEALTVLTQGEDTHHYIVYVQEHTVEIN